MYTGQHLLLPYPGPTINKKKMRVMIEMILTFSGSETIICISAISNDREKMNEMNRLTKESTGYFLSQTLYQRSTKCEVGHKMARGEGEGEGEGEEERERERERERGREGEDG